MIKRESLISEMSDEEVWDFLDSTLLKYGNDDSLLSLSALDGFLTAIVSGPTLIPPSQWYPLLWGGHGREPEWESEHEMRTFMEAVMLHMNTLTSILMERPDELEAMFNVNTSTDPEILIAEDWCFGYMLGVDIGKWPPLPDGLETWLFAIKLHGREENFPLLNDLTLEEHQNTVADIEPAARKLHAFWLAQRSPKPQTVSERPGRNDLCPCGSGKKYKRCCLQ